MSWTRFLNKKITYTSSWKYTLLIGVIMASTLVAILIFLQPFDTYEYNSPTKNLELAGYAPCIIVMILLIHAGENFFYRKQKRQWRIWNEILILAVGGLLMLSISYVYNSLVINRVEISPLYWWRWIRFNGSPFLIFLYPVWIFTRARLGTIEKNHQEADKSPVLVSGQNKKESFRLAPDDFIYSRAQQNYAEIFYRDQEGELQKKMLRITLAQLNDQLPTAVRVHRSYLVNPDFVHDFKGNARKRFVMLNTTTEDIPVSQKYYRQLKKRLSDSSQ